MERDEARRGAKEPTEVPAVALRQSATFEPRTASPGDGGGGVDNAAALRSITNTPPAQLAGSGSDVGSGVDSGSGRIRRSAAVEAHRHDDTASGSASESLSSPRARRLAVQPKLVVGSANDPLEREADDTARRVMRVLSESSTPESTTDVSARSPHELSSPARVARSAVVGSAGGPLDADTERAISDARGGGVPLGGEIRRSMEGAFGADFSAVRMHVDDRSDQLNHAIQARAFTTGSDVFIRRQDFDVGSASGQELLAHELAHTVQQGAAPRIARRAEFPARATTADTIRRETIRRDNVQLDDAQKAQYMDLGPGVKDFAKRGKEATSAATGGINAALAVLPREADGSLTPAAMQMIETFERGVWDSKYEKWMDEQLPAPARKKGLFGKESDKDYRKRIAAAARTLPGAATNSVTGRTRNPELANLTESTGLPDEKVSEKTALSNVGVTLNYNQSDVNFGERAGMISQAFAKISAAGGVLGSDLVFNLPKYGRTFSFSGDCKVMTMTDFGTRAVFVAPNLVHLSSEILGNPNEATEQMTGVARLSFLSAQLDPDGVASIVHELGHYCHYRNNPSAFHSLNSSAFKGREQSDLAEAISGYATNGPREFVAEVFLALVYGHAVTAKAIEMYLGLGGMPVGAARTAKAPVGGAVG